MAKLKYIRHEMFAREYVTNGGNAKEAYIKVAAAYPHVKPIAHPDSYKVVGCIIKSRPDVQRRIDELREKMAKKADITMEKILTDYEDALAIAKRDQKPNEIVNAATAQAKLVGLLRDRVETGGVGEFDGMENISDIIQKVADEAGPEAAQALMKAFGIIPDNQEDASGLIEAKPASDAVN